MRRENDFICEWGMFDLNSSKKNTQKQTKPDHYKVVLQGHL